LYCTMSKNDKYYSPERFMEFIIPERQDDFAAEVAAQVAAAKATA